MQVEKLLNVVQIKNPKPEKFDGEKRYYSTGNIDNYDVSTNFELVKYENRPSRANVQPIENSVGFAKMKSTEKTLLVTKNHSDCIFSTGMNFLQPSEKIISKYLYYYLISPYFLDLKDKYSGQGIMGGLNNKDLNLFKIPVPSPQEQEKIVERLDKVFNFISTQIENIKTQINLNSLIFESYFEKVQSNFMNSGTISEFFDLATGGTPSKKNKDYFINGNIPWLLSGDIHQENILESKNFITEDALKNSNAKYLPIGSVLIALNGQGKTRGTVALLKINATCNQSLVSINSKDNNVIENEFLFYYLKSQYKKIRKLTGDSGNDRRGLNMKIINNMLIKFPEISVQKKIVVNCKSLSEINKKIKKILDSKKIKYVELKNSLLNKVFAHE